MVAGVVLWMLLSGTSTSRHPVWGAIGAVALVYLAFLLIAALWGLPLVVEQALSPFVLAAAAAGSRGRRRDLGRHPVAALAAERPAARRRCPRLGEGSAVYPLLRD